MKRLLCGLILVGCTGKSEPTAESAAGATTFCDSVHATFCEDFDKGPPASPPGQAAGVTTLASFDTCDTADGYNGDQGMDGVEAMSPLASMFARTPRQQIGAGSSAPIRDVRAGCHASFDTNASDLQLAFDVRLEVLGSDATIATIALGPDTGSGSSHALGLQIHETMIDGIEESTGYTTSFHAFQRPVPRGRWTHLSMRVHPSGGGFSVEAAIDGGNVLSAVVSNWAVAKPIIGLGVVVPPGGLSPVISGHGMGTEQGPWGVRFDNVVFDAK